MKRWRAPLALLALLTVAGCSVIGLVYDNADRLALSAVDGWFDLDRAQGKRFRERFRERMAEHRRDELPRYTAFLRELRRSIDGKPTADQVDAQLLRSRDLVELGIRRTLPLMADTLAELTPQQVEHLAGEIAEANEDYAEELAEGTPAERTKDGQKELIKQIERWTGRLDEPQRARLRAFAASIPDESQNWFDHRQQRQRALLEMLRSRAPRAAYISFAEEWWLGRSHLDPQLADRLERNRRATATAFAELTVSLTPKQRARAVARIDDIIEALDELHAAGAK